MKPHSIAWSCFEMEPLLVANVICSPINVCFFGLDCIGNHFAKAHKNKCKQHIKRCVLQHVQIRVGQADSFQWKVIGCSELNKQVSHFPRSPVLSPELVVTQDAGVPRVFSELCWPRFLLFTFGSSHQEELAGYVFFDQKYPNVLNGWVMVNIFSLGPWLQFPVCFTYRAALLVNICSNDRLLLSSLGDIQDPKFPIAFCVSFFLWDICYCPSFFVMIHVFTDMCRCVGSFSLEVSSIQTTVFTWSFTWPGEGIARTQVNSTWYDMSYGSLGIYKFRLRLFFKLPYVSNDLKPPN